MTTPKMTPELASTLSLAEQHEWFRRATSRRALLRGGMVGAGALAAGPALLAGTAEAASSTLSAPALASSYEYTLGFRRHPLRPAHRLRDRPGHADVRDLAGPRRRAEPLPARRQRAVGSRRADRGPGHRPADAAHRCRLDRQRAEVGAGHDRAVLPDRHRQPPDARPHVLLRDRPRRLRRQREEPRDDAGQFHHRDQSPRAVHLHRLRRPGRHLRRGADRQPRAGPAARVPPGRGRHLLRRGARQRPDHGRVRPARVGRLLQPDLSGGLGRAVAGLRGQPRDGGLVLAGRLRRHVRPLRLPAGGRPRTTPSRTATSPSSPWTPTT